MHCASLDERIASINSDQDEINKLVEEYKPFIAACVERVTGRYARYGEDDELSIALMAFVEAVKAFDRTKGRFLSFAQGVIRRRLIDFFRKEKKHGNTIYINDFYRDDENDEFDLTVGESVERFSEEEVSEYRRMELQELKNELSRWDISFFDLAEASPKQDKTRKIYMEIVSYLKNRPDLIDFIKTKKYLPIAEIEKEMKVPRKTIERARKYIIAVLIVNTGDYQYIKDYIDWG